MPRLALVFFLSLLSLSVAKVLIGDLVKRQHNVSGTLYALDTRTLRLENFYYDGKGPDTAFWLNTQSSSSSAGRIIPFRDTCEEKRKIRKYTGEIVELELPPDLTLADIGYFSVWCIQAKAEFGGIPIDATTLENLLVLDEARCPKKLGSTMTRVFPVQKGWNCESLNVNYQVRWRLDANKTKIDFQLVARLRNGDQWMGFGPSGSDLGTQMVGSDVAIAYRRDTDYFAIDYHLDAQRPCDPPEGVCPDTLRNETHGVDDVSNVEGEFKEDITMVSYRRPVKVTDTALDKDIVIDGPAFVTWAYGPLQVQNPVIPLFHLEDLSFPQGQNVVIEFGREPSNQCSQELVDVPQEAPSDLPGFERPVLHDVKEFNARIGPSGGLRGVSAILGRPSWGIAWYLSDADSDDDVLIPVIGVERGKTYTFNVFGGIPADDGDTSVQPFYITSSSTGGYERRTPRQRATETVYAGIEDITKNKNGGVTSYKATATGALCKLETSADDTSAIETYSEFFFTLDRTCTEDPAVTANAGTLEWKVSADTPDTVYYQSVTNDNLGYLIRVFPPGKVNVTELQELSGGGSLEMEDEVDLSCIADFKETSRSFQGCTKNLGRSVDVFWNVNETAKVIETLLRTKKRVDVGYVGIGWGFEEMRGSSAVLAFEVGDDADIGDYFLAERNPAGVQPNNKQELISSEADNSGEYIRGLFTRRLEVDGLPPIPNGKTSFIWSIGPPPGGPTSFAIHQRSGTRRVDLTLKDAQIGDEVNDLDTVFVVHGVFMGISWLVLVPTAITAIRFFKKYNPITFNVHRGLNGAAALLTIAGFIMAVVSGSRTETTHLAIGSVVLSLVIVQVLAGALRPHKDKPLRKPWYWGHALLGSALSVLGIANCFLGIRTRKIGGPTGWYIAVGVVVGLFLVVQVVFFFMPKTFPRTDEAESKAKLREQRRATEGRTFVRDD